MNREIHSPNREPSTLKQLGCNWHDLFDFKKLCRPDLSDRRGRDVRLRGGTSCPSHLFHPSQKPWNFASPPDTLSGMHKIIEIFADRAALHTEILALRQQVAVLKRKRPRPLLRKADRVFWVILSCLWPGWRHALVIVRPETVIGWHRKGFRLFWTWKSRRGKPGRPPVSREIRYLVRRMSRENTRWWDRPAIVFRASCSNAWRE